MSQIDLTPVYCAEYISVKKEDLDFFLAVRIVPRREIKRFRISEAPNGQLDVLRSHYHPHLWPLVENIKNDYNGYIVRVELGPVALNSGINATVEKLEEVVTVLREEGTRLKNAMDYYTQSMEVNVLDQLSNITNKVLVEERYKKLKNRLLKELSDEMKK